MPVIQATCSRRLESPSPLHTSRLIRPFGNQPIALLTITSSVLAARPRIWGPGLQPEPQPRRKEVERRENTIRAACHSGDSTEHVARGASSARPWLRGPGLCLPPSGPQPSADRHHWTTVSKLSSCLNSWGPAQWDLGGPELELCSGTKDKRKCKC